MRALALAKGVRAAPRVALVALVAVAPAVSSACREVGGSSNAHITVTGGAAELVQGELRARLPAGDVRGAPPSVVEDAAGRIFAYKTDAGAARIVHRIGDGLFAGPLVAYPPDFRAVPDVDHSLGPLFEAAGGMVAGGMVAGNRRAELVRQVERERGKSGVTRLLVGAAYVDDPVWEETTKGLGPEQSRALGEGLVVALEPGKPRIMFRRAVRSVDLDAPGRRTIVVARSRDPIAAAEEPRSVAVLLRTVLAHEPREAAELACEILARKPEPILAEAAVLALVVANEDCPDASLVPSLLGDRCLPWFRCNARGPLSWSDTSKQDEPPCTETELAEAIRAELARSKVEVLDARGAARPGLFAFAAAVKKGRMPEAFVRAHERRRYALVQLAEPPCDDRLPDGTPCHCSEASLRLKACEVGEPRPAQTGVCRFDVDDTAHELRNVVRASPVGTTVKGASGRASE